MNTAVRSAFKRIDTEYRPPAPPGQGGPGPVAQGPGDPASQGYGPGGPASQGYSWGDPTYLAPQQTFSANRAFDKLIILVLMAVVSAAVGYVAVPPGLAFGCMAVAFGLVLIGWFRMRWAKVIAPLYAVLEGLALGSFSGVYATIGHGIVPMSIVFTAAVFVATLVLYRTGLVRVTPKMMSLAFMGAIGLIAVGALSLLGLSLPGVNSFGTFGLIFGVAALVIAVLNLFTDFAYVTNSEASGVSAEAEWAAAFAMMTALVLVYISILRILASAYGGGGRRR
ncbi:MAG: Bax inhibitor-1/YccA family membrane protein [Acidimicrobiales bacterium]